jgi:hypothetical protein
VRGGLLWLQEGDEFQLRTRGLAGHVYRIKLVNFMCHAHLTVCSMCSSSLSRRTGGRSWCYKVKMLTCHNIWALCRWTLDHMSRSFLVRWQCCMFTCEATCVHKCRSVM